MCVNLLLKILATSKPSTNDEMIPIVTFIPGSDETKNGHVLGVLHVNL